MDLLPDNNDLLKLIEGQNKGLPATTWKIIKRTDEATKACIYFGIDDISANALFARGEAIAYRFRLAPIQVLNHPLSKGEKEEPAAMEVPADSVTAGKTDIAEPSTKSIPHPTPKPYLAPAKVSPQPRTNTQVTSKENPYSAATQPGSSNQKPAPKKQQYQSTYKGSLRNHTK